MSWGWVGEAPGYRKLGGSNRSSVISPLPPPHPFPACTNLVAGVWVESGAGLWPSPCQWAGPATAVGLAGRGSRAGPPGHSAGLRKVRVMFKDPNMLQTKWTFACWHTDKMVFFCGT